MDAATEVIDEGRVGEPDAGHEIDVPTLARLARVRLNVEALSRKFCEGPSANGPSSDHRLRLTASGSVPRVLRTIVCCTCRPSTAMTEMPLR